MSGRVCGPIESAVLRDLQGLDDVTRDSPLAASALHLARVQDLTFSARDSAAIAREFRATWAELTATAEPTTEEVDELDLLRRRRSGSPDPAGSVGS